MNDTLVIAISQSGTTTDTNRTVDLVRGRGAKVVAIVNRRGSDLTDKSDGVLYTSDGRDVEMSVASTKAFYSQVAAGFCWPQAIAAEVGGTVDQAVLAALRDLPAAMVEVLDRRPTIAEAAHRLAPAQALLGGGRQRRQPHRRRRGADQAVRALLQVDRQRLAPRTRSTSTCRPSRSSSSAPPGSRARPPTTWPRRWRSTGRTRRRRS